MEARGRLRRAGRRRERLVRQGAFLCSLLLSLCCLARVLPSSGHGSFLGEDQIRSDKWRNRRLMVSDNGTWENKNCTEPAINEFPGDLFTVEERKQGAIACHILCALYMFYALAIVCDDFFVPALEKICEKLHMSEDVAGATFMAAASSTPELFTSVIGVFITHGDVGVGTIVGSAVFNILCIIGICGIFAGQVVHLTWWPLLRDSMFYTISIITLITFIHDEAIMWWESLILLIMYMFYILLMKYNLKMQRLCTIKRKNVANGSTVSNELQNVKEKQQHHGKNSVVMVDEIICSSPPKFRFPEASLRLMITNKFGPKTRLRMASRFIINERQKLSKQAKMKGVGKTLETAENGNMPVDREEEPEGNSTNYMSPFSVPDDYVNKLKWLFTWPLMCLMYFTIPNCSKPRWENLFMLTFIMSTLWIAIFSYIMVWMVAVIGFTLGIPDVIMGITFLAAGTSVPDCMASLIVARQGLGDMAVSNTIGSNVFDILIGLGVPWSLKTMVIDYGSNVRIKSKGLVYSIVLLLGSVTLTVFGIHANKWRLDKKLGFYVLFLYAIFLFISMLIEFNVFTFINLPMCRDAL
ncbi:sodium/potassium/calcium exchanger 4 isoform X2 [Rhinatrema bivittatum]|uniref:sodium/potassium/calcium exchanger 4 isoform X2 n=1 Tax=Rhinatrema bivittatum TaxID=194408 RepID=UPI001125C136|nr:sodium/potassium/calcium exchanger 4 isoform X2 [Rhinatrema bivittatum]